MTKVLQIVLTIISRPFTDKLLSTSSHWGTSLISAGNKTIVFSRSQVCDYSLIHSYCSIMPRAWMAAETTVWTLFNFLSHSWSLFPAVIQLKAATYLQVVFFMIRKSSWPLHDQDVRHHLDLPIGGCFVSEKLPTVHWGTQCKSIIIVRTNPSALVPIISSDFKLYTSANYSVPFTPCKILSSHSDTLK